MYDLDDLLDDLELYGSMFLVGVIVVGIPALLLWLNWKMING